MFVILKESELHHNTGSLIDGAHPGPRTDRDYPAPLSLCRFKGLRTVTAQIISIGPRTWVSPIYQAPYAVMKLRFFGNLDMLHEECVHNLLCMYSWQHAASLRIALSLLQSLSVNRPVFSFPGDDACNVGLMNSYVQLEDKRLALHGYLFLISPAPCTIPNGHLVSTRKTKAVKVGGW